jgi:DNA mismatch repair protein MutL
MSDVVHLLPDHIANQIAAGEVIQRPASVVKELMENAVDAGATVIAVNIRDAGRTLIQVIDNGKGMSEMDARMSFERHATSKISKAEDLFSLRTMGFRGEALPSIAAVAQVDLYTRSKELEVGTFISIAGSNIESVSQESCNVGSIFSVKNLFYNVPARRKFLKSNETEFRHIISEFERITLVNRDISFVLKHNDVLILDLPATVLRQRIVDLFGKTINQKLLPINIATSLANIDGYVGTLESVKKRSAQQFFFVNGRYMRHPYFHKAIMLAYEKMIPTGDMPDYFIYFTLDPSTIDVNIHPTKTEIKFENEKSLWQILISSVKETLAKSNSIPSIDFETKEHIDIPVFMPESIQKPFVKPPTIDVDKKYNPFMSNPGRRPSDNWKSLYEGFEKEKNAEHFIDDTSADFSISGNETEIPDNDFSVDNISNKIDTVLFSDEIKTPCFQYKNKYIIMPLKSGLVIIDQHRAHVRILYEQYIANMKRRVSTSQKLLFSEIVEFSTAEALNIPLLLEEIKSLGFDLSYMGGNSYAINAAPSDVTCSNPVQMVRDIISVAIEQKSLPAEKKSEQMALSLAGNTAIRGGKSLTTEEMESLVASLFAIEAHGLTPDGLPVLTILTDDELAKRL